jgi:hypothetical protein
MKKRIPAWLWANIVVAAVLAVGLVDWLTGYELNFFVFYFLPVSLAAWFLGFGSSVTLAVLSALVWFGADTTIRLASFLVIGWSVSRMRQALVREHDTAESLRRALSEIKVLEAFLPICAQCKKIRNEQGVWEPLEVYIGQHSKTQFSHGYCPECAKKALEEAGL